MPRFTEYTHLPVVLIAGPTASGKSAMALELADAQGRIILNADSMQLYKHVPLLTARPSFSDLERLPHHLYGIMGPDQTASVGMWLRAAAPYLKAAIDKTGPSVCVVGGTGLYFSALIKGLADIADIPSIVRDQVAFELKNKGIEILRLELQTIDPLSFERIKPNDHQRLIRAISVYRATGQTLSQGQQNTRPLLTESDYALMLLRLDRDILISRIETRLKTMWDEGALDEAQALIDDGLKDDWAIMRVLGLKEAVLHLTGQLSRSDAISQSAIRTRQYAKRQSTWFRNQFSKT
jgi:tRNA dimethylallyltransferase